ncbi:hypothetical protein H2200_007411 [Cladophialophora chaetospira]|uniref:Calcineurin-like phosphoesterase domain-containing protein n=1 Tax=Cladophialophora chaetospira TaxID=386627 RepID=A0AA38X8C7_9EURO|nr:hypothetical protein H2200_007411 [Cladophialophora chaetospira]
MTTRRVRIVCISDTHNQTPRLPSGDILIHAGDLTNQGTFSELQKTVEWIKQSKFQVKVIICGNHDITCDVEFYQQYGGYFHNKKREDSQRCLGLFNSDPSIFFLNHDTKQISIKHGDGLVSTLKIWGSPHSPAHGFWAFGYSPESASRLWDQIPLESDIVITHTPARFHRDECGKRGMAGCEVLRQTLWRVRPRLFVCGHIHEAYGVEVVEWDLNSSNVRFKEKGVREFNDPEPGSKKQFTVDLSSRARSQTLQNDGSMGNLIPPIELLKLRGAEVDGPSDGSVPYQHSDEAAYEIGEVDLDGPERDAATGRATGADLLPKPPRASTVPFPDFEKAERPTPSKVEGHHARHLGTRGQGGASSSSTRSDQEAISGREGRLETCIVNAAFMASNFPHKGGKRFHKPVVIDLDLPVVDGGVLGQINEVNVL